MILKFLITKKPITKKKIYLLKKKLPNYIYNNIPHKGNNNKVPFEV